MYWPSALLHRLGLEDTLAGGCPGHIVSKASTLEESIIMDEGDHKARGYHVFGITTDHCSVGIVVSL